MSADPAAVSHLRASAEHVANLLRAAGLPKVDVLQVAGGQPAVLGRRPGPPGAPTVLLYAHHDVQPPGDRAAWESDPFEPTERDGRLFGRGAADDKAGIAVHLAALRAHGEHLPVAVVVLVEGEEEIGSPTLATFLQTYRDRLRSDVVILADSTNWTVDVPALTTSLRGGANVIVEVRTLRHGVHSGMYGGAVPDALSTLCRLLATLHDERGDVAVAGLVRGTADGLDLSETRLRIDAGVLDGVHLIGTGGLTDRLWARPAIAVIGIDAPSVAAGANTLVPSARAKVSMRVAPGDDAVRARDALVTHFQAHAPWGAHVTVEAGGSAAPYTARTAGRAYEAARSAFAEAWGTSAVEIGVGGSIPFIAAFAEVLPAAEILITGVEDPDTRAHGANESLHLAMFERACLAEALLLDRLGGANGSIAELLRGAGGGAGDVATREWESTVRVLMIAPPGAGKGTQGALVATHFGIPRVATGDLLRDHVARQTELGRAVQSHLERGELVPDEIVLGMVRAAFVAAKATGTGYVLDGIPRNIEQARATYRIALELEMTADVALHLQADDGELVSRLLARAALEGRPDDTEDVIRKRLALYHEVTHPIVSWYGQRGILVSVDAMRPAEAVGREILTALEVMRSFVDVPEAGRHSIDLTGLGDAFGASSTADPSG